MNVPCDIFNDLKCSNCANLLSCGPVHQDPSGRNFCGRCSSLGTTTTPNQPYNSLAKLCAFPCRYEAAGCVERVLFPHMSRHEADCEFRTYDCPVLASGRCGWRGPRNRLLQHVEVEHPEHVMTGEDEMEPDVRSEGLRTFLMAICNVLFLVHVKVCFATRAIYHSVRKLGGMYKDDGHTFKFFLYVDNDNGNYTMRKRDVAPQGSMDFNVDSAIGITFDKLTEDLGDIKNKYTVTIKESMKCNMCKNKLNSNQIDICYELVSKRVFYCKGCSKRLKIKPCINASAGCSWKGSQDNIIEHQNFCVYAQHCGICQANVIDFCDLIDHFRQNHNLGHLDGQFCPMTISDEKTISFSFKNQTYILLYEIMAEGTKFTVRNCRYCDGIKMQCILIIRNAESKRTSHFIMRRAYFPTEEESGELFFELSLADNMLGTFVNDRNEFEIGVDIHCYE